MLASSVLSWMMMMSSGLTKQQPMRVICIKMVYHTFTGKYIHFAYVILTRLSSTYHSCGGQKV